MINFFVNDFNSDALKILLLADDLTGSLDTACPLVGQGWRTRAIFSFDEETPAIESPSASGIDLLAVNLASRHLPARKAQERIYSFFAANPWALVSSCIYKKTDSVLRGNIGAELAALQKTFSGRPVFYAPAMPHAGRTLREGRLFVNGDPVEKTAFQNDPEFPVTTGIVSQLLAPWFNQVHLLKHRVEGGTNELSHGHACYVFDGETEDDLARTAEFIFGLKNLTSPVLLAGPSGVIRHLSRYLGKELKRPQPGFGLPKPAVIFSGSVTPRSREQITHAKSRGCLEFPWAFSEKQVVIRSAREAMALGKSIIVHTNAIGGSEADPQAIREAFSRQAAQTIVELGFPPAIFFGGETSSAILKNLDLQEGILLREFEPGVCLVRAEKNKFEFVTKSGGLGSDDILEKIGLC